MRAVIWTRYGPPEVLVLGEVTKPRPKPGEVLIRIRATTVTAGDCELRGFSFPPSMRIAMRLVFGLRKPRKSVLGMYLAGEVEAAGEGVTRFAEGDQVFGASGFRLGANAEYICLSEKACLAVKPATMSYEEAATVPIGGLNALHFLRKGEVASGESVLINGAGGSIGTYAVQLAKHLGAHVTAVDSADKLDMLRSVGADEVVDYTSDDFTRNGETYDVIFDIIGSSSFEECVRSLKPGGRFLLANPKGPPDIIRSLWLARGSGKKVIFELAAEKAQDLDFLKGLIEGGTIRAIIDRFYTLEQTPEAHRYVETGRKKGNVVVKV